MAGSRRAAGPQKLPNESEETVSNTMMPSPELANATRRGSTESVNEPPTTEKLQSAWVRGKEGLKAGEKRFEKYVSEHPIQSVLIAVGAGVALGWLITRKR